MLDHEDLKWIATTATDLNSVLQQISRYSDLARRHKGEHNYIELLGERVELASKKSQALFDRVTSKILEKTGATAAPAARASKPKSFYRPPAAGGQGRGHFHARENDGAVDRDTFESHSRRDSTCSGISHNVRRRRPLRRYRMTFR